MQDNSSRINFFPCNFITFIHTPYFFHFHNAPCRHYIRLITKTKPPKKKPSFIKAANIEPTYTHTRSLIASHARCEISSLSLSSRHPFGSFEWASVNVARAIGGSTTPRRMPNKIRRPRDEDMHPWKVTDLPSGFRCFLTLQRVRLNGTDDDRQLVHARATDKKFRHICIRERWESSMFKTIINLVESQTMKKQTPNVSAFHYHNIYRKLYVICGGKNVIDVPRYYHVAFFVWNFFLRQQTNSLSTHVN